MLKKKVYILDYDLISPIAIGAKEIMASLKDNFSADLPIERFDTIGIPFKNGAEVKEDLGKYLQNESGKTKEVCAYDRKLELLATSFGIAENRLSELISKFDPSKTGVIMGIGADITQFELFEDEIYSYLKKDQNAMVELFSSFNDNNARMNPISNAYDVYAIYLANKFNAGAFQKSICTACVSSTQAIGLAYDDIQIGNAEVVIAGGTDSLICALGTIAFGKLGVIPEPRGNDNCKPFDQNRMGALAGECAGFVILASEEFVNKYGLKPKAELLGYGNTLDAYKITAPDPSGDAIVKAIEIAISNSGIQSSDIDYINAHGTGTKHNDQLELNCIKRAMGEHAYKVPISSTKSRHGHAIAAAGIQEFCILMEVMKNDFIPGNLNLKLPCVPDMNLPTSNQKSKVTYALTNNFAFGGINTVLALKNMN